MLHMPRIARLSAGAFAASLLGAAGLWGHQAPACGSPAPTTRVKAEACLLELEQTPQSSTSSAARADAEQRGGRGHAP